MRESVALTIHGPSGALDLLVPAGATAHDVARSYAQEVGMAAVPLLHTALGRHLAADQEVGAAGLRSGDVLVAAPGLTRTRASAPDRHGDASPPGGVRAVVAAVVATVVGLLSAGLAAGSEDAVPRTVVAACLAGAGLLGLLPVGRQARVRGLVAPAFASAATYAVLAGPGDHPAAAVMAVCGLVAATTAAVARVVLPLSPEADGAEEGLLVWMVAGLMVATVCGGSVLLQVPPQVPWALLVAIAVVAGRMGPSLAVDVPDQALLELDRLAVTAWSARDVRPGSGPLDPVGVSQDRVRRLVRRGSRLLTAIATAVVVLVVVTGSRLLGATTADVDLVGARALLLFGGGALLLAARSYRHETARRLLQTAGLWCWALLVADALQHGTDTLRLAVLGASVPLGLACLAAGVATGRGWRSVWWARRAELAETVCGALVIAATAVATSLVRHSWVIHS